MAVELDCQVRDVGQLYLQLRPDLIFAPQSVGNQAGYVIEDPIHAKFYRIGVAEYRFISLLDGSISVAEALSTLANTLSTDALSQDRAATICKWLVDTGLAHTYESALVGRLVDQAQRGDLAQLLQRLNPMFIRLPLLRPDRYLDVVAKWVGWLYGPYGWCLAAVIGIVALCQSLVHWDQAILATRGVLAPHRWMWLAVAWLVLKVFHEMAHGVVCRKYGGSVKELGVVFVLLAPLAYVDVTSSWRFRSKWQRIYTAAAGMYTEFCIASCAAILWSLTEPGVLHNALYSVMAMASITTLLFNINPLMRFDGYYILSDLLELPNLYAKGQRFVQSLASWCFFGSKRPTTIPPRRGAVIRIYGLAACLWRIIICASLITAASTMLAGAGIVIAAMGMIWWLGPTIIRLVKKLCVDHSLTTRNRLQFVAMTTCLGLVALLACTVVPSPSVVSAPAIVEYAPLEVVRVGSSGFLRQLNARKHVSKGEVLAVLVNDQLEVELKELELEIDASELSCRSHQNNARMAAYQAELKNRESLIRKRRQKQLEVEALIVRAPIDGQIVDRGLDARLGTYLRQGEKLLTIGNNKAKELLISVSEESVKAFSGQLSKPVQVRLRGTGRFAAVLAKVSPRATTKVLHPALSAPNGGPLSVSLEEDDERQGEVEYQLIRPRFAAVARLDQTLSLQLRVGQSGVASFRDDRETLGLHVFTGASRWLRLKLDQSRTARDTF